ncbi:MAG: hypothetical protein R3F11_05640 [Verrucomicrobiales bacterium]
MFGASDRESERRTGADPDIELRYCGVAERILDAVRPEEDAVFDEVGGGEDRGGQPEFAEDREGDRMVRGVAVVESQADRVGRKRIAAADRFGGVGEREDGVFFRKQAADRAECLGVEVQAAGVFEVGRRAAPVGEAVKHQGAETVRAAAHHGGQAAQGDELERGAGDRAVFGIHFGIKRGAGGA